MNTKLESGARVRIAMDLYTCGGYLLHRASTDEGDDRDFWVIATDTGATMTLLPEEFEVIAAPQCKFLNVIAQVPGEAEPLALLIRADADFATSTEDVAKHVRAIMGRQDIVEVEVLGPDSMMPETTPPNFKVWPVLTDKPCQLVLEVSYANGDTCVTRFNATFEEALQYYLGKTFNIGLVGDNLQKCVSLRLLDNNIIK